MINQEQLVAARRSLGRKLGTWRRTAGLTQEQLAARTGYSRSAIANVETGRESMTGSFWARCDDLLGAGGELMARHSQIRDLTEQYRMQTLWMRDQRRAARIPYLSQTPFSPPSANPTLEEPSVPASAVDSSTGGERVNRLGFLPAALTNYQSVAVQHPPARSVGDLTAAVATAKRDYQSGAYRRVIDTLPSLLGELEALTRNSAGRAGDHVHTLAAGAYQIACSVLIKFGAASLATLAADRSMTAAQESADPVAVAASARAVTHALLASGHPRRATEFGVTAAQHLGHTTDLAAPAAMSVYGALTLRAATAAADDEDRATAQQLLAEAQRRAGPMGKESDLYRTYFCLTNVALHQVSVAASLGDAGQAIDHATKVDLRDVPLAERKASFYVDVARAFTQWGKYDRAFHALCAAEATAPDDVSARPQVHHLIAELLQRSPATLSGRVRALADRVGATT